MAKEVHRAHQQRPRDQADSGILPPMKYWEVIADKPSAAGWSWGYCNAVTPKGWADVQ
jgi:hypothetical protein